MKITTWRNLMVPRTHSAHRLSAAILAGALFQALLLGAPLCCFAQAAPEKSAGNKEDVAAITSDLNRWVKAFNARDVETVNAIFASDYIQSFPGSPDQTKADLAREQKEKLPTTASTVSLRIEEIQVSGDMAFVRDQWTWTRPNVKNSTVKTRSIEIWKRQSKGGWQIIRSLNFYDTAATSHAHP